MLNKLKRFIVRNTCWKVGMYGMKCEDCSYNVRRDCNKVINQSLSNFIGYMILSKGRGHL